MSSRPLHVPLSNDLVELRPLVEGDFEALFQAASDPRIWEQHPQHDRYQRPVFAMFFASAMDSLGAYCIVDRASDRVVGSSRYYGLTPAESQHYTNSIPNVHNAVCIGYTFLIPELWGGVYNRSVKRLMLDRAFLLYDTVVFQIGATNIRSRTAIERLGATLASVTDDVACESASSTHHVLYFLRRDEWKPHQY